MYVQSISLKITANLHIGFLTSPVASILLAACTFSNHKGESKEVFLRKFRDRKTAHPGVDLQDALYLIQIVINVIKRYNNDNEYMPDIDDLSLINEIAKSSTDVTSLAIITENNFHKRITGV